MLCPEHGIVITPLVLGWVECCFCPLCKEKYPDDEYQWYHEPNLEEFFGLDEKPLEKPVRCETEGINGDWTLVNLTKWLSNGKWLVYDEDGREFAVDSKSLRNPHM